MKPPLIHLKDKYGTDLGKHPIKSIHWDVKGNIQSLVVIMTGDMVMQPSRDPQKPNHFENGHGHISGVLIEE